MLHYVPGFSLSVCDAQAGRNNEKGYLTTLRKQQLILQILGVQANMDMV